MSDRTDDRSTDPLQALNDMRASLGAKLSPESDARRRRGAAFDPMGGGGGRSREEKLGAVKRGLMIVAALFAVLVLAPTAFTYINPGHVGIVIHRAGGGVDRTPLGPGIHMRNPLFTQIEEYPTYMQTLVLTKSTGEGSTNNDEINVNSVEGQPLSLDVSMSFELDPSKVPQLYQTFRTDIAAIQHNYVKQSIRQSLQEVVGQEPIADVIGPKKAEVVNRTQQGIAKRLEPYGIQVKQFTINELRAPPAVIEAINTKNVMQQQALTAQNELQKNTFQAQGDSIKAAGRAKAITAEAEAQAKANQLLSASITPTLVQYEMMKKWNGQLPQVSGGGIPMIQLPGAKP
ncbi:band 7 protein [Gemmatirosa kalamazoonensis]|uniref:Band 7 protein n=1 Tax=Gemmatirosa kalamazoonensis TaxID=861299 RepID=W0RE36_9BACT|nr:prohibitin family protein [Gemmatirosa kalamazoonensis]AHG87648.1 band 7 protein [Gemmatirosa kalamazoonensis]